MNTRTHQELAGFIWRICNLLRGTYKRNEYRKVILPLTVLRRFDGVMEDTKQAVRNAHETGVNLSEEVRHTLLLTTAQRGFYNVSPFDFATLLNDPNQLAQNLQRYINGFSPNIRDIIDKFGFSEHIQRMSEKNLLYNVITEFSRVDLSPETVDNTQMGYAFEELIRIGSEQANEEAGEHFTPREVIRLMVNLILSSEDDLNKAGTVKTVYDPACGTGGMLSVADEFLREHNSAIQPILFGQDYNDESWAICKSDILIKGEDADLIVLGDSFTQDAYDLRSDGQRHTFDYMLANPPFGVEWKNQENEIRREHRTLGHSGRFGAGLPRINDGSLLFLQHMLSKMRPVEQGGSRIAIVFNGSPLFTGDAGQGESEIRRWIIENDWLEAIVALPDQLFYNTGIATYIWVLTNRKESHRAGKVQLIDTRKMYVKMRKSLGNKRNELSQEQIDDITRIHGSFQNGETREFTDENPVTHLPRIKARIVSKVFDNEDFGYRKITVERPLRLNFAATPERLNRLEDEKAFQKLAQSRKADPAQQEDAIAKGKAKQKAIRNLLHSVAEETGGRTFLNPTTFSATLESAAKQAKVRLTKTDRAAILSALGERDPEAEPCFDDKGNTQPDPDFRDTDTVTLKESIDDYMAREVLPHTPDAWPDHNKTKMGYEVPLNRRFYVYEPPRPLDDIGSNLQAVECGIAELMPEVTKGPSPNATRGADLGRETRLKPSGMKWIGDIPEHWETCKIHHHFTIVNGGTPSTNNEDFWDGEIAWVTPEDLGENDDAVISESGRSITPAGVANSSARVCPEGSIIMSTRAPIGHLAITATPTTTNQGCRTLVPKNDINCTFAYYALIASREVIQSKGQGSTFMEISASDLKKHEIVTPPSVEQRAIADYLDQQTSRIDRLVEHAETAIARLHEYRTALITAAVTGKIHVRESADDEQPTE